MGLTRTTDPQNLALPLEEAKEQSRIEVDAEDDLIKAYIRAATKWAEKFTGRSFITQTWTLTLDDFPDDEFRLKKPPLQQVNKIEHTNTSGTTGTVSASKYIVDTDSFLPRVALKDGEDWPDVDLQEINGVVIEYVTGYGDDAADVPDDIKQALKMLTAHFYENREDTVVGTVVSDVPMGVETLLYSDRVVQF